MKRILIKVGLIIWLLSIIFMISCSKKDAEFKRSVTIEFWHTHTAAETPTLQLLIDRYVKMNPHVQVKLTYVDYFQAYETYTNAAKNKQAPDIFRADNTWIPDFAVSGYLKPIDDKINMGDRSDFLEAPLAYCQYEGRLWGIPQVTDCLALLYNKKLVSTPPSSYDELIKIAAANTDATQGKFGFCYNNEDAYWLVPFIWGFGGELITHNKEIKIDQSEVVEALEFMIKLRDKDKIVPSLLNEIGVIDQNYMVEKFKNGQLAMLYIGPWETANILSSGEFSDPNNLGISNIPAGPKSAASPVGGHNYVISANTQNYDEAYELIHFLSLPAQQKEFALRNNLLPTRQSTYQSDEVKNNAILQGFYAQLKVARNRPVIPGGKQLFDSLSLEYREVLNGRKSIQEAMAKVAEDWKLLLSRSTN